MTLTRNYVFTRTVSSNDFCLTVCAILIRFILLHLYNRSLICYRRDIFTIRKILSSISSSNRIFFFLFLLKSPQSTTSIRRAHCIIQPVACLILDFSVSTISMRGNTCTTLIGSPWTSRPISLETNGFPYSCAVSSIV